MFSCVPEGRNFSFQDAKNHLISSGINIKSSSVNDSPHEMKRFSHSPPRVISNSPFEKSRSKFIFVDVKKSRSQSVESEIIVRDCDGTLRIANLSEIENACDKTWNRNSPKIIK